MSIFREKNRKKMGFKSCCLIYKPILSLKLELVSKVLNHLAAVFQMEIPLHFLSFLKWKVFKKSKIAQIYYYDPQSAGINLQSPQSDSTPWTLTLPREL